MDFRLTVFILLVSIFLPITSSAQMQGSGIIINENPIWFNYNVRRAKSIEKPVSQFPPFCGNKLRSKGHNLPFPFGAGLQVMFTDQQFEATDLRLVNNVNPITARADTLYQNTTASQYQLTFRPDFWLLSFLNIYGIIGYTNGNTNPNLVVPYIVVEIPGSGEFVVDTTFEIHDKLSYYGPTYGGGATASAGFNHFFILIDYNYTVTVPNDVYDKIINQTFSPRVGILLGKSDSRFSGAVWLGAMYISNAHNFSGDIKVSEIASDLVPIFGETATYKGQINSINKWNFLTGAAWMIGNHHRLVAEVGFIGRKQWSLGYNFRF